MIIALSGPSGCGKSTAPAYLAEAHGFARVRFAGPLKAMVRAFLASAGTPPEVIEILNKAVALALKDPNVHVDTSAYVAARLPAPFVAWMRGPGRTRVLFGSNWPMLAPARCLEGLDALGLDDEARELYLAGNARRVFGLTA